MSTSDLTPTVVLVHGAFVDASSWNGVIAELKAAGLDVVAPPNLLRGVGVDAAYLTGFVEALGRRVVLVAHSYAGAVISQTGSDASNVAGLVYVAAYAPEAGETLGAINPRYVHDMRFVFLDNDTRMLFATACASTSPASGHSTASCASTPIPRKSGSCWRPSWSGAGAAARR